MTRIDSDTPMTPVGTSGNTPVDETSGTGEQPGISGDPGGQEDAVGASGDQNPVLDAADEGLDAQTYSDSADAFSGLSIEDALIALAQASNEDRKSENDEEINKINASYQKSMDAVAQEDAAAQDRYTARMWKDTSDLAGNLVNAVGSGVVAGSSGTDAGRMAASQSVGASAGIISDAGDMVAADKDKDADDESATADSDKAAAQKESSYADQEGKHADLSGQLLAMAIQVFQQKADSELQTNRNLASFS